MEPRISLHAPKNNMHISTVGKSMEPVINGFRAHSVDRQVLLHSSGTADVARKIKERIEALVDRKICELREVDPFDMNGIVGTILEVKNQFADSDISVNITGGTNIMASSALLACSMIGGHAYYVKENKTEPNLSLKELVIDIPMPRVSINEIGDKQKKIIKFLSTRKGRVDSASIIAESVGGSPQIIGYHLAELREKKLINIIPEGRRKIIILTNSGSLFANMI